MGNVQFVFFGANIGRGVLEPALRKRLADLEVAEGYIVSIGERRDADGIFVTLLKRRTTDDVEETVDEGVGTDLDSIETIARGLASTSVVGSPRVRNGQ